MTVNQVIHEFHRFAGRCSVSDTDQRRVEPAGERRERFNGSIPIISRRVRIDDRGRLNRTGFRNHGNLDARTDARIKADHALVARGGCEQQVLQIGAKHRDGAPLGVLTELLEDLGFK